MIKPRLSVGVCKTLGKFACYFYLQAKAREKTLGFFEQAQAKGVAANFLSQKRKNPFAHLNTHFTQEAKRHKKSQTNLARLAGFRRERHTRSKETRARFTL